MKNVRVLAVILIVLGLMMLACISGSGGGDLGEMSTGSATSTAAAHEFHAQLTAIAVDR